ncbi:hypothetical protein MMPV_005470 [Pyropia vietnamensis]
MLTPILAVGFFHLSLSLALGHAASHPSTPLARFLATHGVASRLGLSSFTTPAANRRLAAVGARHRRGLSAWFALGVVCGLGTALFSATALAANVALALIAAAGWRGAAAAAAVPLHPVAAAAAAPPELASSREGAPADARIQVDADGRVGGLPLEAFLRANPLLSPSMFVTPPPQQLGEAGLAASAPGRRHARALLAAGLGGGAFRPSGAGVDQQSDLSTVGRSVAGVGVSGVAGGGAGSASYSSAGGYPPGSPDAFTHEAHEVMVHVEAMAKAGLAHLSTYGDTLLSSAATAARRSEASTSILQPLVPGVNLPLWHAPYLLLAAAIATVVHEAGHALAAAADGEMRVVGVGGFLALFLPGAYVRIEGVDDAGRWRALKVWCAGAWHNVVAAVVAATATLALPLLLSPVYSASGGALVVGVPQSSALAGHLHPGDVIVGLGRHPVRGVADLARAIGSITAGEDSSGFCVGPGLMATIARIDSEAAAATGDAADGASRGVWRTSNECCKHVLERGGEHPTLACLSPQRNRSVAAAAQWAAGSFCLPPDQAGSLPPCHDGGGCGYGQGAGDGKGASGRRARGGYGFPLVGRMGQLGGGVASSDANARGARTLPTGAPGCYYPVLPPGDQLMDIAVVSPAAGGARRHLFFQGPPLILSRSVALSPYTPRLASLVAPLAPAAYAAAAAADGPLLLDVTLRYLVSLSLALAVVNMAPVARLDGEAAWALFLGGVLRGARPGTLRRVQGGVVAAGTALLVANIGVAALSLAPA